MTSYRLSDKVPNFQITSSKGTPSTIDEEMGENGLLVFVLRGTWCVYCVHQLVTTRLRYANYQRYGINATFVAPQDRHSIEEFLASLDATLPFGLHADLHGVVSRLMTEHGAHMGISLLNPNRIIEWQYVGEGDDYATFKTVMSALEDYLARTKSVIQTTT